MVNLKQAYPNGPYYLYEYIPSRYWDQCSDRQYDQTQRLLIYKNFAESRRKEDRSVFVDYTFDLMDAISEISKAKFKRSKGIVLLAIPRSTPNKLSTITESIRMIAELSKQGVAKTNSHCNVPLIDGSSLIERVRPIPPAHLNPEGRDYTNQMNSMRINNKAHLINDVGYVIVDDIVTSGTQMSVCKKLLQNRGVFNHNIVQLAIGRTINL